MFLYQYYLFSYVLSFSGKFKYNLIEWKLLCKSFLKNFIFILVDTFSFVNSKSIEHRLTHATSKSFYLSNICNIYFIIDQNRNFELFMDIICFPLFVETRLSYIKNLYYR